MGESEQMKAARYLAHQQFMNEMSFRIWDIARANRGQQSQGKQTEPKGCLFTIGMTLLFIIVPSVFLLGCVFLLALIISLFE